MSNSDSASAGAPVLKTSEWQRWVGLALLIGAGWFVYSAMRANRGGSSSPEQLIAEVVGSEELILQLGPELGVLANDLMDLHLPGPGNAGALFAPTVKLKDLSEDGIPDVAIGSSDLIESVSVSIAKEARDVPVAELTLWSILFAATDYFEHAEFKIVDAGFVDGDHSKLAGRVKFSGSIRAKSGAAIGVSAKQKLVWEKSGEGNWKISAWEMKKMSLTSAAQPLFSDRLDDALPNVADRLRARHSIHEEELVKYYHSGKTRARSYDFGPIAMSQKPALSVVDYDGDGLDDLYVMVRMGKNLLLRNRGDGTFEERGAQAELAVKGNSTCGIFADFDNDGDPDLMLGRSVERSQYFENTGSWFRPVKQAFDMPALAVSMSAADFNGDGLLDVYVATYRLEALGNVSPNFGGNEAQRKWPERFLSEQDARKFTRIYRNETGGKGQGFLNQVGPPNVLLVNRGGGKFEPAKEGEQLNVWKNTLQATWADIDEDGDPDLYLANDWAPDHLFRNDGEAGFTDVTKQAGVTAYGFGMGASFGDYDQDGRQDIYVTNMYSKAGRRILKRFDGIQDDYLKSVDGNVLYQHGEDMCFTKVSGLEAPALTVAEAGWSWGGQFVDFDNDGDLDIYTLSGHFTAPAEVASEIDL